MISCKWPGLIVRGKDIDTDLAAEIILRTTYYPLYSNDRNFLKEFKKILGFPECDNKHYYESIAKFKEKNKILELEYLYNDMVCSTWVYGLKGWVNWEGKIGCNNYNIGKWPDSEEVLNDLNIIASAFPALDMTVELINMETCEVQERSDEVRITDRFTVYSGNVNHVDCDEKPKNPQNIVTENSIASFNNVLGPISLIRHHIFRLGMNKTVVGKSK